VDLPIPDQRDPDDLPRPPRMVAAGHHHPVTALRHPRDVHAPLLLREPVTGHVQSTGGMVTGLDQSTSLPIGQPRSALTPYS
jgi:hypothetical protein